MKTSDKNKRMTVRKRWYRFFRAITLLVMIMFALGVGFVAGIFASVMKVLPTGEALADIRPPSPTRILACDGTLLAKFNLPSENREIVPYDSMGNMTYATLAIEDVRFFKHPGIDLRGIARAVMKNLATGHSKEGASTITQQLARNLYLTREQKMTRKLQEIILALELERRYSKEEILEAYLNQVYYGSNRYGVQSCGVQMAAKNYFGKNVHDLSIAEAALLAGLPKNPRDYNPYRYPKAAKNRRDTVLASMLDNGFISEEQYQQAVNSPIKLTPEKPLQEMADFHAPYFVGYVLSTELKKIFGQDWEQLVYHYGVDVYTSLDPRMQKVAEEVVTEGVDNNKFRHIQDGALISIDPKTGLIKAMVGGTDYRADQYNIITQGHRQPGSAFKVFDYTTAFIHGYTADTIVNDRAGYYPNGTGIYWTPKDDDNRYMGPMPLKKALWLSRNAAAASVANDVGMNNIIQIAYAMGIKYPIEPFLSSSIGASVVIPLEICSAYGTLANGGVHVPPAGVTRITSSDGEVLYEYSPTPQRAIPQDIADAMKETMRGVLEYGTGRPARCPFPASGKTGTTSSFHDAWFIGYTDDLVTAVWVGNRNNTPMNHTYGATVPAPIWKQYMLVAQPIMADDHRQHQTELASLGSLPPLPHVDTTPTPYIIRINGHGKQQQPSAADQQQTQAPPAAPGKTGAKYTVRICSQTGELATQWCPETILMTYIKGRPPYPPSRKCSVHTGQETIPYADRKTNRHTGRKQGTADDGQSIIMSVCAETGKIATDKCPTVLLRRFRPEDAPTETCPLHGR